MEHFAEKWPLFLLFNLGFIALLLLCALLHRFGINVMYSAFLVGYIVKAVSQSDKRANERMEAVANFSFSLFVPIYFALVGIQLNLLHNFSFGRFLLFFGIAFGLESAPPESVPGYCRCFSPHQKSFRARR